MQSSCHAEITTEGISAYLTILILQENCFIHIGKKKIQGYEGDIVLLRENISFSSDKDLLAFYFDPSLFDSLFYSQTADCRIIYDFMLDDSGKEEYLYFSTKDTDVKNIADTLKAESTRNDMYHEKMIRLLLVGLITLLDRSREKSLIVEKSTMVSDNRFGRIMKYIGDNFKDASLRETAEKFGYNPDYLSARFKKITGETFRHKLLNIRLEKAADLLLSSEMTIDEISEAVGFHDKSWFMHKFKERYQMTPKQYRRNYGDKSGA